MSELEIWNELGNLYYNTGAYNEAIRIYQRAIALDQGCAESYSNLASIYIRQERYEEVISLLQKGIGVMDEAKDKACMWNQLGEVYGKMDDCENAAASYRMAAELDPDNIAFQDNLAEAELVFRRNHPESIAVTGDETETVPELFSTLLDDTLKGSESGSACWVFKDDKPALQMDKNSSDTPEIAPVVLGSRVLSEAARSTNARMSGLLRLGILHWRKGEYERAHEFLKIAIDNVAGPKDNFLEALCYYTLALVETDMGKFEVAIQSHQSAATLAPERIFPWNNIGNLNCMLERYDDALAAFREAIEHDPKDAVSWNALGDLYHKLGRNEDAIAAYQLGNVFEKQDFDEDPLKAYETSMEADRENPQIWNEAGDIYFETGAYDDAAVSYHQAIELDPTNAVFQTNLAKVEQAREQAHTKNESSGPESKLEVLPQQESYAAETTFQEPAETNRTQLNSVSPEQVQENEIDPEKMPPLPDQAAGLEPEPEASYWVFGTEPSLENALQPVARSSASVAETALGSLKPLPAFTTQPVSESTFSNAQMFPDTDKDVNVLMVQLPPRALPPTQAKSPAPQVVSTGNHAAEQASVDLNVLENDIAAYRRVTEINPGNDRAWDALGNMYEAVGLHNEAIAAFEQAIAIGPRKEVYHYHLGIALAYQMHYDKAIQALEKVVALNPNYVLAHCALAAYYRRIGADADAQEHIRIARPSMENENEYNRACFESISGNTDQAIAYLEIALEKQQIQPAMLRSDPDLDFIRADARFDALLHQNSYASR